MDFKEWMNSDQVVIRTDKFGNEQTSNDYPTIGDTIKISDINYDMMDYFDRTNRKLLVIMNNGEELETSVGKFYNDLVFHGKFPSNLDKKDISFVKIIG
jgi:hypothetical protein